MSSIYELDIDPKTVCRLCLEQPASENVFLKSHVEGQFVSITDIIKYTLDIHVSHRRYICIYIFGNV